jgi:lipoic acid synthetase
VEILTPDFKGDFSVLKAFDTALPDIFNHNLETVPRLYSIRPGASYTRSLSLLRAFKERYPEVVTKSGLMVGLGETADEIRAVLDDLRRHQCESITIGQYLNPSEHHTPINEFVKPEQFTFYEDYAKIIGFKQVFCAPFVRSSYRADETIRF